MRIGQRRFAQYSAGYPPFNEGMKQVVQAIAMIGDIASQYGIIIAIEPQPLNRRECNNLNTVKEAA